jgi:hypothetical protein
MATLQLESFIDSGKDAVGGVGGSRHVGVGQDGQELWRRAAQDPRGVNIAHRASQRSGHRFEGFVRWAAAVGLDQKHTKVSLVAVSPRQLVFEHGPHETIIEEPRRPIHDVERLGLWVVGPDSARWAEDRTVGQGRPASQASLSFRPAAQEVANRHRAKAYQPGAGSLGKDALRQV